jgi:hypothetical protein
MKYRKQAGYHDRKNRHRFGKPGNGVAPARPEEQQDCGNQSARMADPDPKDEVDNAKGPGHGDVIPPDADAGGKGVPHEGKAHQHHDGRASKGDKPGARRFAIDRGKHLVVKTPGGDRTG